MVLLLLMILAGLVFSVVELLRDSSTEKKNPRGR